MTEMRLAGDGPAGTEAEWLKAVAKSLSGASFETLRTPLYEGFRTEPLYVGATGRRPLLSRTAPAWRILQLADYADVALARRQVEDDLANGCGGLWLQFGGNLPYAGGVLGARTSAELAEVIAPAKGAGARLYVSGGADTLGGGALLAAAAQSLGWPLAELRGSLGLDPLSVIAASGELPADRAEIYADAIDAAHELRARNCALKPFLTSARAWHQAGGSAIEDLAFTLAAAVSYWRALARSGFSASDAASAIDVILPADADLFLTIARFRAMRLLWSRALEAAGAAAPDTEVLAEMSFRMLTERDPHVNLLRAAAAAFGAGIGGADAVLIAPFDAASGASGGFGRRMARNVSLILQQESHLNHVRDAAAGSAYIDRLTETLAAKSWELFREIEAQGGFIEYLVSGQAARRLAAVRGAREAAISRREFRITGVSAFPNLSETPAFPTGDGPLFEPDTFVADGSGLQLPPAGRGERFRAMIEAAAAGASIEDLERACRTVYEPLAPVALLSRRLAEPFESLRRASDLALARVGSRPPIFVAPIGPAGEHRARLNWVQSFFAAGGIECVTPDRGYETVSGLLEGFRDSPAPVACLCASDRGYARLPGAVAALKEANAMFVYLAGPAAALASLQPQDRRAVDRIIYEGCDAAGLLAELHQILRVEDMGTLDLDEEDFA